MTLLLSAQLSLVVLLIILSEERKISIKNIYEEIAERDQIISSALGVEIECMLTGENEIALKILELLLGDMLTVLILVLVSETEVDQSDLMKGLLMISVISGVTNDDVV